MKLNSKGIQLIKTYEGCLLNAYQDSVGIWTIGYGATFYKDGRRVKQGDKITQEQANDLLEYHGNLFAEQVKSVITSTLTDNQFSALVSFAFNLGIGSLKKSTLLKKVNTNPADITIRDEFNKWVNAGGKKLTGLVRRRTAEANLYFS